MYRGQERCIEGLVGKPHKNISRGRPRCRWEYNIKKSLQEVGWGSWKVLLWLTIGVRWRAVVNAAMNLRISQTVGNFLTG
jgi:hypothetical protein